MFIWHWRYCGTGDPRAEMGKNKLFPHNDGLGMDYKDREHKCWFEPKAFLEHGPQHITLNRAKHKRTVNFTNSEMDGRYVGTHFAVNGPWHEEWGIDTGTWWLYPDGRLILT